jgi:hypothetical protein
VGRVGAATAASGTPASAAAPGRSPNASPASTGSDSAHTPVIGATTLIGAMESAW